LQLMTLVSWIKYTEAKVKELKRVFEKEEKEPLYIRVD